MASRSSERLRKKAKPASPTTKREEKEEEEEEVEEKSGYKCAQTPIGATCRTVPKGTPGSQSKKECAKTCVSRMPAAVSLHMASFLKGIEGGKAAATTKNLDVGLLFKGKIGNYKRQLRTLPWLATEIETETEKTERIKSIFIFLDRTPAEFRTGKMYHEIITLARNISWFNGLLTHLENLGWSRKMDVLTFIFQFFGRWSRMTRTERKKFANEMRARYWVEWQEKVPIAADKLTPLERELFSVRFLGQCYDSIHYRRSVFGRDILALLFVAMRPNTFPRDGRDLATSQARILLMYDVPTAYRTIANCKKLFIDWNIMPQFSLAELAVLQRSAAQAVSTRAEIVERHRVRTGRPFPNMHGPTPVIAGGDDEDEEEETEGPTPVTAGDDEDEEETETAELAALRTTEMEIAAENSPWSIILQEIPMGPREQKKRMEILRILSNEHLGQGYFDSRSFLHNLDLVSVVGPIDEDNMLLTAKTKAYLESVGETLTSRMPDTLFVSFHYDSQEKLAKETIAKGRPEQSSAYRTFLRALDDELSEFAVRHREHFTKTRPTARKGEEKEEKSTMMHEEDSYKSFTRRTVPVEKSMRWTVSMEEISLKPNIYHWNAMLAKKSVDERLFGKNIPENYPFRATTHLYMVLANAKLAQKGTLSLNPHMSQFFLHPLRPNVLFLSMHVS